MAETSTENETVETEAPAKPKRVSRRKAVEQHVRSYVEAIGRRDVDGLGEHWSPDGVEDLVPIGILRGREEVKDFFREVFAAMPDAETRVLRVVAGETSAAVEWRMTGTFTGAQFQGVDPTGKPIDVRGLDFDQMEFARQLGMMPPMDSGAERAMKSAFNTITKARRMIAERTGT
jgi:limonene-1,2-epoxide hydrolase